MSEFYIDTTGTRIDFKHNPDIRFDGGGKLADNIFDYFKEKGLEPLGNQFWDKLNCKIKIDFSNVLYQNYADNRVWISPIEYSDYKKAFTILEFHCKDKKKGIGTAVLEEIIQGADLFGYTIFIEPTSMMKYRVETDINTNDLKRWYSKYDFKPINDNYSDYVWLRNPKNTDIRFEDGGKVGNFKYSLTFGGITIYTNIEQEYVGKNYSPFESKGSFKADIRKSDLDNIAIESEQLKDFNFQWGVDNWKSISQKLKNKGINKLELYIGGITKTYKLKVLNDSENTDIDYAGGGKVYYLKGKKILLWKILKNNYLTYDQAEENNWNYSRLNIFINGELDEFADVKAFDKNLYYDFDMFEKQIKEILKDKSVTLIELQYGDTNGSNTQWLTLYGSYLL